VIGSYLIQQRFKLIKVLPNTKIVVPPNDAVDDIYILRDHISVGKNGRQELKNIHRVRPYLSQPYETYWCSLKGDCPSLAGDDCPSGECRPYDSYWDGYDIGFPCGAVNNVLVFDIDPRNIPNFKDLKTTIGKIQKAYGILPRTWTALTPSGGVHLYYKCAVDFNKNTSIQGVDIIGTGFWVKLPPYTNASNVPYVWKEGFQPGSVALAKAPPWLINKVSTGKQELYKKKDLVYEVKDYTPSQTKNRVKNYLDRLPISNFHGSEDAHDNWLAIGRYLCSHENSHLGTKQLFLDWCAADPKGTLTPSQLSHLENRTDCHIGKFFVLAKYLLGEK